MYWFIKAMKDMFNFKGRARRKEYWLFYLFGSIISLIVGIILGIFEQTANLEGNIVLGALYLIIVILLSIAFLSVTFRRLHDTGRSGWWIWIQFIPLIGGIVIFVFTVLDSEEGMNKYGENPKALI